MQETEASTRARERIRVVSLVQAETITGPMKPLLMFSRNIQVPHSGCTGISLSVVTTVRARAKGSARPNRFVEAAEAAGLGVDKIPERFPFDPTILPQLARFLAARRPEIVESHDFKSHFLIWLLKMTRRLPGKRWIAFHHGYTRMSPRVRLYQHLDRLTLRKADQVITVCAPFVQQLVQRGVEPHRIKILRNAIEIRNQASGPNIQQLRRRLGLQPTDRVILNVGRLSVEKGHPTLIAAYRQLMSKSGSRDFRLILVGDGGEMHNLRAATADLGDRVIFTSHVDDPWPYYCFADVFVLPSYSEGSPLVLFEAMSAGLPIIASSVGGVPETLSDGVSAVLVPAGSVIELAQALDSVLNDPPFARRLGQGAHAIAEEFTPERYTRERIGIYESLLRKSR